MVSCRVDDVIPRMNILTSTVGCIPASGDSLPVEFHEPFIRESFILGRDFDPYDSLTNDPYALPVALP